MPNGAVVAVPQSATIRSTRLATRLVELVEPRFVPPMVTAPQLMPTATTHLAGRRVRLMRDLVRVLLYRVVRISRPATLGLASRTKADAPTLLLDPISMTVIGDRSLAMVTILCGPPGIWIPAWEPTKAGSLTST